MDTWTDQRMDDLARALAPVPSKLAELQEAVDHLETDVGALRGEFNGETLALRQQLWETQRQLVQIAWGLVAALIAAIVALIAAVV